MLVPFRIGQNTSNQSRISQQHPSVSNITESADFASKAEKRVTGYHSSLCSRWIGIVICVKRLLVLTNQLLSAVQIMGNIICCYCVARISDHLVPCYIRESSSFIWVIDWQATEPTAPRRRSDTSENGKSI